MTPPKQPKLTVVILVQSDSWMIRHALRKLREQTIATEIEVIAVAPAGFDGECIDEQMQGLWGFTLLKTETFDDCGRAKEAGVRAASAGLIAFVEDHSYPEAHCMEAYVRAVEEGQLAAAGPVMRNANPDRGASWACFLAFYGEWMTVSPTRGTTHLPANQSCYKREVMLAFGDRLSPLLQAESVLQWELQSKGLRVRQAPEAFVYHLNNSRLGHTLREYFFAARLFAARRSESWSGVHRLGYALGMALLPLVRWVRIAHIAPATALRVTISLLAVLGAGAAGEMLGYLGGAGDAARRLANLEARRDERYDFHDEAAVEAL